MKSIANRMIVFAVSAIAFGTLAFGQTRLTAEIPFAFRTATATLPAGNYEISQISVGGRVVRLMNTASIKSSVAGQPVWDAYQRAGDRGPSLDFACTDGDCTLAAIHTYNGTMTYTSARKSKRNGERVAVISIPLKVSNGD